MKRIKIIYLISILIVSSCRNPSATITPEFIEVSKPGQMLGLIELDLVVVDPILNYPVNEKEIKSFQIVDRRTNEVVRGNRSIKIFFNKINANYYWKESEYLSLASEKKIDVVSLKKNTWYRLSTEKYKFDIYIYIYIYISMDRIKEY